MPRPSTIMPPAVPMRLITAFALERRGFGVTSGMRATAGERKVAIESSVTRSKTIKSQRSPMIPRIENITAAATVPQTMKGVRLPKRVDVRSEIAPKRGSRTTARMLSSDMINPESASSLIPYFPFRSKGTMVSYACQNAEIRKKAKPTRIVRL